MSALITDKCVTPCGELATNSSTGIVDAAGNIQGSAQFLTSKVVDYAGNLGVYASPAIGYLNYPGVTHVDTWTTDMQDISTNRQLTANATIGCLEGYSIIESGVMNPAGFQFNVGGDATTLGPFNAGGRVILTGNSTQAGATSTIFAGGTLQCGLDPCATSGRMSGVGFAVQNTAVLNLYGAYTTSTNLTGAGNTVASGGTVNIEGCGTCGTGMINYQNNGIAAGGVLNITNAYTVYANTGMAGTINLLDGSSLYSSALSYTGTIKLNATSAWKNASCVEQYNLIEANGQSFSGKVEVGANGGSVGSNTTAGSIQFNATLSGSGPLRINGPGVTTGVILNGNGTAYTGTATIYGGQIQPVGNALVNSQVRLGNAASFLPSSSTVLIKSLQSVSPADTTARLFVSLVGITISNQDPEPFYGTFVSGSTTTQTIIQAGNFQIASTTGAAQNPLIIQGSARVGGHGGSAKYGTAGALTISTANGGLSLLTKPSTLTVGAFTAASGFKVDIGPDYAASPGTYTILTRSVAGTNTIPTVGTNASGLTPTFSWSGNNLLMTLA